MSETGGQDGHGGPTYAIGPGGSLPRRVRRQRCAVAFALLILLGLAKYQIPRAAAEAYLTAGPGRPVVPGLVIGPAPSDGDLQQLADSAQIGGVVNLGGPSVAEQVTAAALHLAYLRLPVPLCGAPTWRQLRVLVFFMRIHATKGDSVYLHDDTRDGRAATAADMLLMLHGTSWHGTITGAGAAGHGCPQQLAIRELDSALRPGHGPLPGNPYSAARRLSW